MYYSLSGACMIDQIIVIITILVILGDVPVHQSLKRWVHESN